VTSRLHAAALGGFFATLGAIAAIVGTMLAVVPFAFALAQLSGLARAFGVGLVIAAGAGATLVVQRAKKNGVIAAEVSSAGAAIGATSGLLAGVLIGFSHSLVSVLPYSLYSGWSKYVVFPALGAFLVGTFAAWVVPPVHSAFVLGPGLGALATLVLFLSGREPARVAVTPGGVPVARTGPAPPLGPSDLRLEPPRYVPVPEASAAEPPPPHRTVVIGDLHVGVAGPGPTIVALRSGAITAYGVDDGVRWSMGGGDADLAAAGSAGDTMLSLRGGSLLAVAPEGRVRWIYDPRRPLHVLGTTPEGRVYVHTAPDPTAAAGTAVVRAIDTTGRATDVLAVKGRVSDVALAPDGSLLVRAGDRLLMHDPAGAVRWSAAIPGAEVQLATFDTLPPAPLAGGAVIYGGRTLRAYGPDGQTRWAITLQFKDVGVHAIVATPAGRVYVENSALLAIEDGRELWRWDKTLMIGRPLIGADGTVYVRDTRGVVYALSPAGRLRWIWRPEPVQREAHPWDAEKLWLADDRLVAELDSGVAILDLRARSPQGTLR
jgi:outer membrane protein assembly factor BamB